MSGLFSLSSNSVPDGFVSLLAKCESCKLYKKCNSPKLPVRGKGKRKILIVSEYPSGSADNAGKGFVGESSLILKQSLAKNGIDMVKDCWLTYANICKPDKGVPTSAQVVDCRPNILRVIKEKNPEFIILLGTAAVSSVIGHYFRDKVGPIQQWAGFTIRNREPNAWLFPIFPPDYVLKTQEHANGSVVKLIFDRQIQKACKIIKKGKRPWRKIKDERKEIEIVLSPKKVQSIIRSEMKKGGLTAFDFETTMLRPNEESSHIVTCSICFRGERTIAYPLVKEAVDATKEYLKSDLPKVGANMKFEHKWAKKILNCKVRNWVWDTVLAAHVLDNRPGITSVKFQAYVMLGVPAYDRHIQKYLRSKHPREPNRVKELDLEELLTYNGMDALVEYRLALVQSKKMRITLPTETEENDD